VLTLAAKRLLEEPESEVAKQRVRQTIEVLEGGFRDVIKGYDEMRIEDDFCAHCGEEFVPVKRHDEHCAGCILLFQKEDIADGIEPREDYSLRALTNPETI